LRDNKWMPGDTSDNQGGVPHSLVTDTHAVPVPVRGP